MNTIVSCRLTYIYGLKSRKRERFVGLSASISKAFLIDYDYLHSKYGGISRNKLNNLVAREIRDAYDKYNNIIINLESLHRGFRYTLLNMLKDLDIEKNCVVLAVRYKDTYSSKLDYSKWETPHKFEGWDNIRLVHLGNSCKKFLGNPEHIMDKYKNYEQSKENHKYTLGEHMRKSWEYLCNKTDVKKEILCASMIHDMGKPFSRVNDNGKMKYCTHENIGAYDSLFCELNDCDKLSVSNLINLHMEPYRWKRSQDYEKTLNKHRKIWGDELFNDVMTLHESDVAAHK